MPAHHTATNIHTQYPLPVCSNTLYELTVSNIAIYRAINAAINNLNLSIFLYFCLFWDIKKYSLFCVNPILIEPRPWHINTIAVNRLNYCEDVSSGNDCLIILFMNIKLKLRNNPATKLKINMFGKPNPFYFSFFNIFNKLRSYFWTATFTDYFWTSYPFWGILNGCTSMTTIRILKPI